MERYVIKLNFFFSREENLLASIQGRGINASQRTNVIDAASQYEKLIKPFEYENENGEGGDG